MQDNSTDDIAELLIKYMDGELNATEKAATEQLLREDVAVQERYQYFLTARKAIKSAGFKQRVQAIHQEYIQEVQGREKPAGKRIKFHPFKRMLGIAAVLLLIVAGYGVYQYTSASSQSLYSENYITYQLPVNRGEEKRDSLGALYNAGKYDAVISSFNQLSQKDQNDYFLAAQAYLQLNKADAAIAAFQQVEKLNAGNTEKFFEQETDYYLALAYIKADKIDLAEKQLDKIKANKQHLFYNKANEISRTKLKMLKWKEQ